MSDEYQPALFETATLATAAGLEFFQSAKWQVDDLFSNVPFHIGGTVLEPCAGLGAIAQPLRERGLTVITNDVDPRKPADLHFDACDPRAEWPAVDWVITNPPFSLGVPICLNMLPIARYGVILQLRTTFSEPTIGRDLFFAEHKPHGKIEMMRYSFTGDGNTDSTTSAWYVWLTGNPPLFAGDVPGYQVFSRHRQEFFRIARRHTR